MSKITSTKKPKIHHSWLNEIEEEFKKPYMENLRSFLMQEKSRGAIVFPPSDQTFTAIYETSLDDTKVVIIGQGRGKHSKYSATSRNGAKTKRRRRR